jgi:hypothetical protein
MEFCGRCIYFHNSGRSCVFSKSVSAECLQVALTDNWRQLGVMSAIHKTTCRMWWSWWLSKFLHVAFSCRLQPQDEMPVLSLQSPGGCWSRLVPLYPPELDCLVWTERRGQVVNTPSSYSGAPGMKTRPRRPAILIEFFRCFPQFLQADSGIVP